MCILIYSIYTLYILSILDDGFFPKPEQELNLNSMDLYGNIVITTYQKTINHTLLKK